MCCGYVTLLSSGLLLPNPFQIACAGVVSTCSLGLYCPPRSWSCWSGFRGCHSNEGWNPSAARKGWESWGWSAWRGEGFRETSEQPARTYRELARKMGTDFLAGPVVIGRGEWL